MLAFNDFFHKILVFKNSVGNLLKCDSGVADFMLGNNSGYSVTFACKTSFPVSPYLELLLLKVLSSMKKGRAEITLLRPTLKVVFDVVNFSALCFLCISYYEVRCFLDLFFGLCPNYSFRGKCVAIVSFLCLFSCQVSPIGKCCFSGLAISHWNIVLIYYMWFYSSHHPLECVLPPHF